ncbi:MAG: DNA recombination protein RmuC [bacterium]|nr:DNA recombination protein RmuC [bacterium]
MNLILPIIIGVAGGAIVAFLILRAQKPKDDGKTDKNFDILNQRLSDMAAYLDRTKQSTDQALRDTVKMVGEQLKDSRESVERSSQNVHRQVQAFTTGLTQMSEGLKQVHESVKGVVSFQDIFKAPKLRGIWGEASLESALGQYFPRDGYQMQYYFKNGEAVDAVLKLPNELLLSIDAKAPWENFEKMVNADNDINREVFKKTFFSDVKKKIDDISSKYIRPSEGTADLALMYIPAETVYYEIVNNIKDVDIGAYARSKKVILVSPNTFMLSVSAIRHWLKDVQMNSQTKAIMKKIDWVIKDAQKLEEDFKRLGKHLSDAQSSYGNSEKRLSLMTGRAQSVLEAGGEEEKKLSVGQDSEEVVN